MNNSTPEYFKGKILMITGGTGSFGVTVLKRFLTSDIGEIRIFSRDEKKQDDLRHTLQLKYPEYSEKVRFFIGDVRNNMSYAWMYGCAKMGMHFVAYGPQTLINNLDSEIIRKVKAVCEETGATIEVKDDIEVIKNADVIYSDIWASMGEEAEIPERVKLLTPFRIDMDMIKATENPDVIFLHCLPSFHDFETTMAKTQKDAGYDIREVTDEVFRSKHSKVFDEAENRMHTIKSVIVATIG